MSFLSAVGAEERELPVVGSFVMAHEIRVAIGVSQFEVPVVWCQPGVEELRDLDTTVSQNE
jgi:hypothetical protein